MYAKVEQFINDTDRLVKYVYPYGSRVYGTHDENSDYDYIGICLLEEEAGQFQIDDNTEITIYSLEQFMDMIGEHHITALECLWVDNLVVGRTPPFKLHLSHTKLRESISEKISHSWVKGKKKLTVGSIPPNPDDHYIGLKSIFHAFRICDYGIQLAYHGKIVNYASANKYWGQIMNFKGTWEELDKEFRPQFNELKTEFRKLCPKSL